MPLNRKRLAIASVAAVAVAALGLPGQAGAVAASVTSGGSAPTTHVDPDAPTGGTVPGTRTGAAARKHAGTADTRFGQLRQPTTKRAPSSSAAERLHEAWEVKPNKVANGAIATQSIDPDLAVPTKGGDVLYTPTLMPGKVSCVELTTYYWQGAAELGVWDWCADKPGFDKTVGFDATFLSTYTTTVHDRPAYTAKITQTDADANEWTVWLYNYKTDAFDSFYTSKGTTKLSGNDTGWDMWEIYTTVDPATGNGYYCPAVKGHSFESSDLRFWLDHQWQDATDSNTSFRPNSRPSGSKDFQCSHLTFSGDNGDWVVTG